MLALGLKFHLTDFIHDILCHYRGALSVGGRGMTHCFEHQAHCKRFLPGACRVKDFSALYMVKRTKEGGRSFDVRSDSKRLIVNLVDSDHERRDTVIRIQGA